MKLGIYGAGGMGREVMVAAKESGMWEDLFFILDPEYIPASRKIKGCRVFSLEETARNFSTDEVELLICIGEPSQRKELFDRVKNAGLRMGRFVDPSVKLHEDTVLGEGVIILRGCILASDIFIGDNSALSYGVILGHDNKIGNHCYLAPAVATGGFVTFEDASFGGLGCLVRENRTIGSSSIVGQGAVVVRDVLAQTTVMGNPAREKGDVGPRKVFG
ncbi:MAG: NeuD/PglB/VioB family sugar acetyltransferase [Oscillospiraceae bacterium]|nr:NeuD/PglB/VioB family sugar acetyltransferase [Oscillospiraceae bacterium]